MSITTIPYTATILTKDDVAKTMEVQYSSAGFDTLVIGVRYPRTGETVDGVVADAAPIEQWKRSQLSYVIPDSGVSFNKTFNIETTVPDTLPVLKAKKQADIDKFRDTLLNLGFTYNGHTFDSDFLSLLRLCMTLVATLAGTPLPVGFVWRDKSDANVPTTETDLANMVGTCLVTANTIFQAAWSKKAEVDAATTAGQIAAVTWVDPRINWTV